MTEAEVIAIIAAVPGTLMAAGAWRSASAAKREAKPNSGSTMRDGVDRIEKAVGNLVARADAHDTRLATTDTRLANVEAKQLEFSAALSHESSPHV